MNRLKALFRQFLEKVGYNQRFNDSHFYRLYRRLFYSQHFQTVARYKSFTRELLEALDARLVFDIGANSGQKTTVFSQIAITVISVEPNPAAARMLRERFLYKPNVTVVQKGIGAREGVGKFHTFGDADNYNTFSAKWADALKYPGPAYRDIKTSHKIEEVPVTTLDKLIEEYGLPSYIKIDVEGYELEAIQGLSRPVPLLSFECNLPEFTAETLESISLLSKLSPAAQFNYCTGEPPGRFDSSEWLTPDQISTIVRSENVPYMEIYCKTV